ncbi:MAG: ABC transporter substrate-binding protein [Deinococcales bacterium]|nr:ABC transporter substrate-binding protein [Deinococcales bacterium]
MPSTRFRLVVSIAALLLAVGLPLSTAFAQPVYGGTLIVGLADDPPQLDPHLTTANASRTVLHNIFATLVEIDAQMQIVPGLAESWSVSDDGLRYSFTLTPDVVFHDGTPVDAEAVAFNFARMMDPGFGSPRAAELAFVDEVVVTGPLTFEVIMSQPFAAFLPALASWTGMMVSPTAVQTSDNFEDVLIGAGPFRFVEQIRDDRVVLEKNPTYFREGLPYLDGVVYRTFVDGDSRVLNLESGALHIINTVPGRNVAALEKHPEITLSSVGGLGYRGFYVNTQSADLGNRERRRAVSACIDRQVIVDTVFGNAAVPGSSPFSPATWVVDLDDPVPPRDLDFARQMLAEAGVPDGFSFTMLITPDEESIRVASMMAAMCAEVGITINLQQTEFGTMLARLGDGNYTAAQVELSPRNDPDLSAYPWFHSEATNWGRLQNAELDDLLTRARAAVYQAERRELYRQVNEVLNVEFPYVFTYHMAEMKAYRNELKGYRHIPDSMMRFEDVWLADD